VSLLALSAIFKAKLGPPIVLGGVGGITLSSKDTLKETSSAVCKAMAKESFIPICDGRGSYNFIKSVYWDSSEVSNKALLAIKILLLPKFTLKSSK